MATNSALAAKYMGGMDQSEQRGYAVWFDQHVSETFRDTAGEAIFRFGRPWWAVIELKTGHPTGPVMPAGWRAPYLPPEKYVTAAIGRIPKPGASFIPQQNTDRIRIDYQAMLRDDIQATAEHWQSAVAAANAHNLPLPQPGQPMDYRVLALVGPAPRPPQIAEAFIAGNLWLLGQQMPERDGNGVLHYVEDERLAKLLRQNTFDIAAIHRAMVDAEQQRPAAPVPGEVNALLQEMRAMRAEIDALKKPKKGGRPRKVTVGAED